MRTARPGLVSTLDAAVAGRRTVRLDYRDAQGRRTRRLVDPLALHLGGGVLYLLAWCHRRKAVRLFHLSRIREAEPQAARFTPPADFDAAAYLARAFGVYCGDGPHDVDLEFSAACAPFVRHMEWFPGQQLDELPRGRLRLRFTASGLPEITRWVLGFADGVTIRSPEALRREVLSHARTLLERHDGHDGGA